MARRSQSQVSFTGVDQLAKSIAVHDQKVKRAIALSFLQGEDEATRYAKANAPWTDRTGNARAGLHAKAQSIDNGNAFDLTVAHTMFYGLFLETRFSGKYAIIMPTVNHTGRWILNRVAGLIKKLQFEAAT